MDIGSGAPLVQRRRRVSLDGLQPEPDVEHALELEQQARGGHRWHSRGVHTASLLSGAPTGRAGMTGSQWPPASAAASVRLPPPADARTINKPARGSSTSWISAQPVSRFAPPET